jgi:hypothetical protein
VIVHRVKEAERELEKLARRYRDLPAAVEQFERLLREDKIHGEQYSGLGLQRDGVPASIWKSRVVVPSLGGSRSGLRYVYERFSFNGQHYAIGLVMYVHQSGIKENDVRSAIKTRFNKYEDTAALCLSSQL